VSVLSDRIAEVLREHWWFASRDGEAGCNCNWRDGVDMAREQWAAHVAERVEAELQLTEETRSQATYQPDDPWATTSQRRWVSAWSEDKQ
jgi:hypothetical protein